MIEIPKNDWKPDPIDEKKVDMAIKHIVMNGGGTLGTMFVAGAPACLENLSVREIRYICQRFVDAEWHVYVPELRQNGRVPVTISKLPEEEFNLNKVERQKEVFSPDIIRF